MEKNKLMSRDVDITKDAAIPNSVLEENDVMLGGIMFKVGSNDFVVFYYYLKDNTDTVKFSCVTNRKGVYPSDSIMDLGDGIVNLLNENTENNISTVSKLLFKTKAFIMFQRFTTTYECTDVIHDIFFECVKDKVNLEISGDKVTIFNHLGSQFYIDYHGFNFSLLRTRDHLYIRAIIGILDTIQGIDAYLPSKEELNALENETLENIVVKNDTELGSLLLDYDSTKIEVQTEKLRRYSIFNSIVDI